MLKLVKIKQLLKFIYEFDNNDNNVQCSSCQKDLGVEQLTDYQRHDSRFKSSVAIVYVATKQPTVRDLLYPNVFYATTMH